MNPFQVLRRHGLALSNGYSQYRENPAEAQGLVQLQGAAIEALHLFGNCHSDSSLDSS